MSSLDFSFKYFPKDGASELDAYDASQALYGISRSLSIFTHYAVNGLVIKKAPALKGARVTVRPPVAGSFEFLLNIKQFVDDYLPTDSGVWEIARPLITDLAKTTINRLTGKKDTPDTQQLNDLIRTKHGDLNAIADAVEEDIVRIQRPLIINVNNIVVSGNNNVINDLNNTTYDYAKTKVIGANPKTYLGHVTSYNGSTVQGRFWVEEEERTIGFSVDKKTNIPSSQRKRLAWSLNQWVNALEGHLHLTGYPLTSKQGLLKHIYITAVERA